MILGRVLGSVTSTIKHPAYDGKALLIVEPIDGEGRKSGDDFLAVDRAQSGPGDRVLVLAEGNGVRQLWRSGTPAFPVLETIVAVVDAIEVGP